MTVARGPHPVVGLVADVPAAPLAAVTDRIRGWLDTDADLGLGRDDAWVNLVLARSRQGIGDYGDFAVELDLVEPGTGGSLLALVADTSSGDDPALRSAAIAVLTDRVASAIKDLSTQLIIQVPGDMAFPAGLRTRLYNDAIAQLAETLPRQPRALAIEWAVGALRLIAGTIRRVRPEERPWLQRERMAMLDAGDILGWLTSTRPDYARAAWGWLQEAARARDEYSGIEFIASAAGLPSPRRPAESRLLAAPVDLAARMHDAELVHYRTTDDGRRWAVAADVLIGQWVRAVAHDYLSEEG